MARLKDQLAEAILLLGNLALENSKLQERVAQLEVTKASQKSAADYPDLEVNSITFKSTISGQNADTKIEPFGTNLQITNGAIGTKAFSIKLIGEDGKPTYSFTSDLGVIEH